jgi:hypothetical protein
VVNLPDPQYRPPIVLNEYTHQLDPAHVELDFNSELTHTAASASISPVYNPDIESLDFTDPITFAGI